MNREPEPSQADVEHTDLRNVWDREQLRWASDALILKTRAEKAEAELETISAEWREAVVERAALQARVRRAETELYRIVDGGVSQTLVDLRARAEKAEARVKELDGAARAAMQYRMKQEGELRDRVGELEDERDALRARNAELREALEEIYTAHNEPDGAPDGGYSACECRVCRTYMATLSRTPAESLEAIKSETAKAERERIIDLLTGASKHRVTRSAINANGYVELAELELRDLLEPK